MLVDPWLRMACGREELARDLREAEWSRSSDRSPWFVGRTQLECQLEFGGLLPEDVAGEVLAAFLRPRGTGWSVAGAVFWYPRERLRHRSAVVAVGWSEWHGSRPCAVRFWTEARLSPDVIRG